MSPNPPGEVLPLKASTAFPGPSRVHSHHPRQGKGTELKAGFAELRSVRQVTALGPWRTKPRCGSGRVSGARAKLRAP